MTLTTDDLKQIALLIESAILPVKTDVNILMGKVSKIEQDVSKIQGEISQIHGQISKIQGEVSKIDKIERSVDKIKEEIEITIIDLAIIKADLARKFYVSKFDIEAVKDEVARIQQLAELTEERLSRLEKAS